MPVVGFNLEKTLAEKTGKLEKGMRARHNITITSVDKEDIVIGKNTNKPGLKFSFEYQVDYEPKIGKVLIAGSVLFLDDEKTIKNVLDGWKKTKNISQELTAQILNTAIVKSTIKALNMAHEINLPPHLPIPTISPRRKEQDYIG